MKIYYSDSPIPDSITYAIFLAGPSPRDNKTLDWRVEALDILKSIGFIGEVFVPIPEGKFHGQGDKESWNYINQIDWECTHRHIADKIVFWVPRDIAGHMPGFTTNVEFGEDLATGKVVYGRPEGADKCRYLDKRYTGVVHTELRVLLESAVVEGALRSGGEIYIPAQIWQRAEFQDWYSNLGENKLVGARVLNKVMVCDQIFSYMIKVNIWVEAESRYKDNEFVFFRRNCSNVLAYYDKHVVLVREFRSSVNNSSGYVYELPGGSSFSDMDMRVNAAEELREETGIHIEDTSRFIFCGKRQLVATLSAHTSDLYKVELTKKEFEAIDMSSVHGVETDSEKTYVEVVRVDELKNYPLDFSTLGMILANI